MIAKYDYIWLPEEDGSWKQFPAMHPCGEPIDDEFIETWNENNKLHDEWVKAGCPLKTERKENNE